MRLREAFDLPGVPIRLTLREKANPYAAKTANRTGASGKPARRAPGRQKPAVPKAAPRQRD